MKYKSHSLLKNYGQETAEGAAKALRQGLLHLADFLRHMAKFLLRSAKTPLRLAKLAQRFAAYLALRWDESLLRRYIFCLGEDLLRCTGMMRLRSYVSLVFFGCTLMSLGFLVINPPVAKPSYQVRVDMSRPITTPLSRKEAISLNPMSPSKLAVLYEAETGNGTQGWYKSGNLNYAEATQIAQGALGTTGHDAFNGAAPVSAGSAGTFGASAGNAKGNAGTFGASAGNAGALEGGSGVFGTTTGNNATTGRNASGAGMAANKTAFSGTTNFSNNAATGRNAKAQAAWHSSRSFMGIENGRATMRSAIGSKSIVSLGDVEQSPNSTLRPSRTLNAFASGTASPEALLAELSLQNMQSTALPNPKIVGELAAQGAASGVNKLTGQFAAQGAAAGVNKLTGQFAAQLAAQPTEPNWNPHNYGTGIFDAPTLHWSGTLLANSGSANICPQDRMEQASWLHMLYASHSKKSAYTVRQAAHYRPFVEHYSSYYALQPSLVYAIMRVESGFNPLAISTANALGLMQVVPATAGNEVHAYLNGIKAAPKPELLFKPESNIQYGTTYLHLLMTRHFKEVRNPLSRELCIIAAYNGGPSAVYRVFSRNRERAMQQINRLTPEQLYAKLLIGLYSQETRDYLPKVLTARNDFLRGKARIE